MLARYEPRESFLFERQKERMAKNTGHVTKNAVTSANLARKAFRFNLKISESELKANLHRGWVGVAAFRRIKEGKRTPPRSDSWNFELCALLLPRRRTSDLSNFKFAARGLNFLQKPPN
jgi:hypothetical protein